MHTTRNRLAQTSRKGAKVPPARDAPFMLRQGVPPQSFPADLIVPPHRGAVITAAAWPESAVPAPARPATPARPPISRKAAKKAARRAAAQERAEARSSVALPIDQTGVRTLSPPDNPNVPALDLMPAPDPHPHQPAPVEVLSDHAMPLPAARALVPRRQGFVDVLAFMLRDSGRRLARWSSAKRRADDMKVKLAKAEARMRAMEAQLAALQALQERVRQS